MTETYWLIYEVCDFRDSYSGGCSFRMKEFDTVGAVEDFINQEDFLDIRDKTVFNKIYRIIKGEAVRFDHVPIPRKAFQIKR